MLEGETNEQSKTSTRLQNLILQKEVFRFERFQSTTTLFFEELAEVWLLSVNYHCEVVVVEDKVIMDCWALFFGAWFDQRIHEPHFVEQREDNDG